jgi:NitT/TauT family transport system ATP-binding protein
MKYLSIENLYHKYGIVEVLNNINLDVRSGETVALVGQSGCGKSTLLHLIAGLLTCSEGRIRQPFERLACMFQSPRLLPWQSAQDNIAQGLKARGMGRQERHQAAQILASRLGLAQEDLLKYPHELSGGMQSRVSLARALIVEPELLLLDEPFSALDIGLKLELYQLLRQHVEHKRTTVIMITHDLMEAVRLADRILMMAPEPGRILAQYPLEQPHEQRDDAWIYQTSAKLLQEPLVRFGFELDGPLPDNPELLQPVVHGGCAP